MKVVPLVGRERQLAAIEQLLDDIAAGRGGLATIRGAAGCGKTRLLVEARERTRARGFRALAAAAPMVGARPLSPLAECLALDGAATALGQVIDDFTRAPRGASLGPRDPQDRLLAVIDAAVELLEDLSQSAPTLLLLDDVQWAEPTTLQVVAALSARLPHLPVGIVVAGRPVAPPNRLDDLITASRRADRHLEIDDLDRDQVAELVASLYGAPAGARLGGALERVGGNPLLVTEMLSSYAGDDRLVAGDGTIELVGDDVTPPALAELVNIQVESLPPDLRELLRMAAVLGDTFAPAQLAVSVERSVRDLSGPLDHLISAGFLEAVGDQLTFRHDLVHDAVYDSVAEPIRRDLHREIADRLRAAGAPVAACAHHVLVGARPGDADASRLLRRVAADEAAFAPASATIYVAGALAIEPDPAIRAELRGELARARFWCGESARAENDLGAAVAELPDGPLREELAGLRAQVLILLGRMSEAADLLEELGRAGSPDAALHLSDAAVARLLDADLAAARALALQASDAARAADHRRAECQTLGVLSWTEALAGCGAPALELALRAADRAEAGPGLDAHRDIPFLFLTQTLSWLDRSDEAEQAARTGIERGRSLGMAWHEPIYASVLAEEHIRAGRWDDALADAESVIRVSSDTGTSLTDTYSFAAIAHVLRRRGDLHGAQQQIDAALERVSAGASQGADFVFWELGELQIASTTSTSDGVETLRSLWAHLGSLGIVQRWRQFATSYARAVRVYRPDLVDDLRAAGRALADTDLANTIAVGRYLIGLADLDPDAVEEAIAGFAGTNRPIELAEMHEELAILTARDRRRATDAAGGAITRYEDVGATVDAARVRDRLAGHGVRLDASKRAARPRFGWDSLTPSERAVVGRVASGATNSEIADDLGISVRTVESHLHHAYTKVGCATRVELAVEAAQRGLGAH